MAFLPNTDYLNGGAVPSYMGGGFNSNFGSDFLNFGKAAAPAPAPAPVPIQQMTFGPGTVSTQGSDAPSIGDDAGFFMMPQGGFSGDNLNQALQAAGAPVAPGGFGGGFMGGIKSTFGNGKGGLNMGNISSLLQGIGSIGGLIGSFKQLGLAKDALNFSKKSWETNLANQTKSYNTAISDRAAARAAQYGDPSYKDDYINKNKL